MKWLAFGIAWLLCACCASSYTFATAAEDTEDRS